MKKFIVVLADGMADMGIPELNGKTPLMAAKTLNIDMMAKYGLIGMAQTIPEGMFPGSDTANLAVLGYNPEKYYSGRSPLEAFSIGLTLSETDVSFRCNLVTLSDDLPYESKTMIDHGSDEISSEEAHILIKDIQEALGTNEMSFFPGFSYRHILLWKNAPWDYKFTPPHDILGRVITEYMPDGQYGAIFTKMMKESWKILNDHPINLKRADRGLNKANSIWLWGEGRKPAISSFSEKYGLSGAVISAVDLVKGIGLCAGMDSIDVQGATGTYNTNYAGKINAALKALRDGKDFVYIHLEGPDECGHRAEINNKVTAIEKIDDEIIGPLLNALRSEKTPFRVLVIPDHQTPISIRTHNSLPVPFLIYDSEDEIEKPLQVYDEEAAQKTGIFYKEGYRLMDDFLQIDS